ncbi:MAG: response regulator [Mariprofundaceae bacterium]|nr:response regulator [Mariprofundaceae bacterium]
MSDRFTVGIFGFRRSEQIIVDCFLKKGAADDKKRYKLIHDVTDGAAHVAFVNMDYVKSLSSKELAVFVDVLYNTPCVLAIHKGEEEEALLARFAGNNKVVARPINFSTVASMMITMLSSAKAAGLNITDEEKGYCVLVVDDSQSLRLDMKLKLGPIGIEVDVAEDANQGLRSVSNKKYNLVFMDVMMPGGMDGFEACRTIKQLYPNTPVIMLSSKGSMFSKVRGKMAKCDGYITKPASLMDLKEVFDEHVFNQ